MTSASLVRRCRQSSLTARIIIIVKWTRSRITRTRSPYSIWWTSLATAGSSRGSSGVSWGCGRKLVVLDVTWPTHVVLSGSDLVSGYLYWFSFSSTNATLVCVLSAVILSICSLTDISATVIPIGVKFCMSVSLHIGSGHSLHFCGRYPQGIPKSKILAL